MNSRYSIWLLANAISLSISLASDLTMSMMRTQLISPFLHKSGPSSLLPSLWFTPASSLCSYRFQWAVQYLCGYSVDWKAIMLNHSVSGGIRWMGTVPKQFQNQKHSPETFSMIFLLPGCNTFPYKCYCQWNSDICEANFGDQAAHWKSLLEASRKLREIKFTSALIW